MPYLDPDFGEGLHIQVDRLMLLKVMHDAGYNLESYQFQRDPNRAYYPWDYPTDEDFTSYLEMIFKPDRVYWGEVKEEIFDEYGGEIYVVGVLDFAFLRELSQKLVNPNDKDRLEKIMLDIERAFDDPYDGTLTAIFNVEEDLIVDQDPYKFLIYRNYAYGGFHSVYGPSLRNFIPAYRAAREFYKEITGEYPLRLDVTEECFDRIVNNSRLE